MSELEKESLSVEEAVAAAVANKIVAQVAIETVAEEIKAHADKCDICAAIRTDARQLRPGLCPKANALVALAGELQKDMKVATEQVRLASAALLGE